MRCGTPRSTNHRSIGSSVRPAIGRSWHVNNASTRLGQGLTGGNDGPPMARILVTEEIADGGLDRLRAAGHQVDVQLDLSQLMTSIVGAHALIIRSATQ